MLEVNSFNGFFDDLAIFFVLGDVKLKNLLNQHELIGT